MQQVTKNGESITIDYCHCCGGKQPNGTMVLVHHGRTLCVSCLEIGCPEETQCRNTNHARKD